VKLLSTGDWHAGAGQEYGREPWDRLADQDAVADKIAEIARERQVDAVLFGGDGGERRKPTPRENLLLAHAFRRFAPIPVIAIPGNHDVSEADGPCSLDIFAPELLTLQRTPGVVTVAGTSIACLPWTPISRLVAARDGGDRAQINREAAGLLIDTARGLRAQCEGPCVLLLHWSVEGGVTATGVETLAFAEPVLPLADLEALGFDAVFASHVHKPMAIAPGIIQVGSPMPLSFGEPGDHGVWIVDVSLNETHAEFVPIESRPFVTLDRDWSAIPGAGLSGPMDIFDYGDDLSALRDAIVRVRYTATAEQARRIDHRKLRDALYAAGAHKVYAIEASIERETRARVEGVDETLGEAAALDAYIEAQGIDTSMAEQMRERTGRYLQEARA